MGNIPEKEKEYIENTLVAGKTSIEKKVGKEYFFLKNVMRTPKQYLPQQGGSKGADNFKVIIRSQKFKKRIERLSKWFKMIYGENFAGLHKAESIGADPRKAEPPIPISGNTQGFQWKKIINEPKRSFFESALKYYYVRNKPHFIERVSKGPPESLRWISWIVLSGMPQERYDYVSKLSRENIPEQSEKQILLDIGRTFDEKKQASYAKNSLANSNLNLNILSDDSKNEILNSVLRSLAFVDPDLGYCQGMNFIAAFLLVSSDFNTNEVFYLLMSLFSSKYNFDFDIRGFYIDKFPLLSCFLFIFDTILSKDMPDLYRCIKKMDGLDNGAWIGKWIQTLYTICLPYEVCVRLWDCILSNGIYFVISFSMALLNSVAKDLMTINDDFDFINYFNNLFVVVPVKYDGIECDMNSKKYIHIDNLIDLALSMHYNYAEKGAFKSLTKKYFESHPYPKEIKKDYNITFSTTETSKINYGSASNNFSDD